MKSGELERLFGVSSTTIRNWTSEFADFLSESARKEHTRQRAFTEDDILVLATIAKLSSENINYDGIRSRLRDGERVDDPSIANFGVDTRMVPAAVVEQVIDASELRVELERTKGERDKLLELLDASNKREEVLRQKAEEWQSKAEELQEKISNLQRELGKAEGRLEEKDKRRRWL